MKQDPIIYGGIAGIIGTIAKELVDFISVAVGFSKHTYWHVAASIFVEPKEVTKVGALVVGALADLITGAFFGILLLFFVRYTKKDYLYLKGLGFGWFIWLFLFGIAINLEIVHIIPMGIGTSLSAFIEHSIFGLTTVWFIGKYAPKLIED